MFTLFTTSNTTQNQRKDRTDWPTTSESHFTTVFTKVKNTADSLDCGQCCQLLTPMEGSRQDRSKCQTHSLVVPATLPPGFLSMDAQTNLIQAIHHVIFCPRTNRKQSKYLSARDYWISHNNKERGSLLLTYSYTLNSKMDLSEKSTCAPASVLATLYIKEWGNNIHTHLQACT